MNSPMDNYKESTDRQFADASKKMLACPCGKTPALVFPLYTTQICTFVECACGKIAHGQPMAPMSAVLKWNEANGRMEV